MMEFRADLHCHSTCSDGSLSPEDLVKHAAEVGLKGLSITDHDTTSAYATAMPAAKKIGLEVIPGVEFSSSHQGESIHILGYAFDPAHPSILALSERHASRRGSRNQEILNRLAKLGMPVSDEDLKLEVQGIAHTIGRPHIAKAMVKKGYVESIQEAFKKYLGEGRLAYVPGTAFSVEETIQTIHEANGLAVIAHPHLIDNSDVLQKLLEMDFNGIECYYGNFAEDQNSRWLKIAKKKGWLATGGSDFHGDVKPAIPLGRSWVGEETFRILQEHYKSQ